MMKIVMSNFFAVIFLVDNLQESFPYTLTNISESGRLTETCPGIGALVTNLSES